MNRIEFRHNELPTQLWAVETTTFNGHKLYRYYTTLKGAEKFVADVSGWSRNSNTHRILQASITFDGVAS